VTCREFAQFIADYLSGELTPDVTQRFERHLAVCPNCVAYLANYRDTIELGRRAFAGDDADVPGEVPPALVQAILASRRTRGHGDA
jgi:anti-sigma factor RsiW